MRKAPRKITVDLVYVDKTIRECTKWSDMNKEGPTIPIHLTVYKYDNTYKLVAYRHGKLIYRKERRK